MRRDALATDRLGTNIGYQLHLAARFALHEAHEALAAMALTPARVTALIHIRDQPGCDQAALGRFLMINRSAGMKIANRLAECGLIERRQGRDKRSRGLFLTPAGMAALDGTLACLAEAEARFCARLDPDEQSQFLGLLQKLQPVPNEHPWLNTGE